MINSVNTSKDTVDRDHVPPPSPVSETLEVQLSQPPLVGLGLQPTDHPDSPALYFLKHLLVFDKVGCPGLHGIFKAGSDVSFVEVEVDTSVTIVEGTCQLS